MRGLAGVFFWGNGDFSLSVWLGGRGGGGGGGGGESEGFFLFFFYKSSLCILGPGFYVLLVSLCTGRGWGGVFLFFLFYSKRHVWFGFCKTVSYRDRSYKFLVFFRENF